MSWEEENEKNPGEMLTYKAEEEYVNLSVPVLHAGKHNKPRGYKTFFTLNSVENKIYHAHKC